MISDELGGDFDLAVLDEILEDAGGPLRPLLVGHDPAFSDVVSALVGAEIVVRKGALVRVDAALPLADGQGGLRWLIPPDALKER